MVSLYYNCLFPNGKGYEHLARETRREFRIGNPENGREKLPLFIVYVFFNTENIPDLIGMILLWISKKGCSNY
jgi:hypothetical protein